MNTRASILGARTTRSVLAVVAIAGLGLSLLCLARPIPVQATTTTDIYIESTFIGASSATFSSQDTDCGPYTTGVVWHFILNNFDSGTPDGSLTAQFKTNADVTVQTSKTLNNVQHFYVNTPTDDILDNAWATIDLMNGQTDAKLVLSHVCHTGKSSQSASASASASESASASASASESASQSASASASNSPEGSVEAATGSPEGSVEAATGSPAASVPNTAIGSDPASTAGTLLFALILVMGMSTLAVVNVRAARKR